MSDYMFVLESHLDAGQNRVVAAMQRLATEADMNVWLTGGAMRDMLRGAPFRDLDFTVRTRCGQDRQSAGGVAGWNGSFRRPPEALGGTRTARRHHRLGLQRANRKVSPSPAANRRSLRPRFTKICRGAISPSTPSRCRSTADRGGLLVDPSNGQADLANRELRATNPYIFFDDPSRIFRLIRFQHVLGFELAARTKSQLENALLERLFENAPREALSHEIRALAQEPTAVAALEAYDTLGLLKVLSPGFTGPKLNAAGLARFDKVKQSVIPPGTAVGWLAFLTVLTEKLNVREKSEVVRSFRLSAAEAAEFKTLEPRAKKLESALRSARIHRPSDVWHVLHTASTDEVLIVLYSSAVRVVQDRIRAYYEKYLPQAREVTEDEVAATGAKRGTAKFLKTHQSMIAARLNARPRKVVVEPEPVPEPPAAMVARGRKQA